MGQIFRMTGCGRDLPDSRTFVGAIDRPQLWASCRSGVFFRCRMSPYSTVTSCSSFAFN